jgi:hypothetical protein
MTKRTSQRKTTQRKKQPRAKTTQRKKQPKGKTAARTLVNRRGTRVKVELHLGDREVWVSDGRLTARLKSDEWYDSLPVLHELRTVQHQDAKSGVDLVIEPKVVKGVLRCTITLTAGGAGREAPNPSHDPLITLGLSEDATR